MLNTDPIEARLCAYVEGDLDASERAQIEQHLEGNPQHRKLLEDLIRAREVVRNLPKVSAPPEIVEAIQSQLERSVLLERGAGDPDVAGRIGYWPRVLAVAAIILLAVGLIAVVIFVALPPSGMQPPPVALTSTAQPTGDGAVELKDADDKSKSTALGLRTPEPAPAAGMLSMPSSATPIAAKSGEVAARKEDPSTLAQIESKANAIASAAKSRSSSLETETAAQGARLAQSSRLAVQIASSDPVKTQAHVVQYLGRNSIAWTDSSGSQMMNQAAQPAASNVTQYDYQRQSNPYANQLNSDNVANSQLRQQVPSPAPDGGNALVVLAHGMSRRQINELRDSLAAVDSTSRLEVQDPLARMDRYAGAKVAARPETMSKVLKEQRPADQGRTMDQTLPAAAATQPAGGGIGFGQVIGKGDMLSIAIAPSANAQTVQVQVLEVGAEGTIRLPKVGPVDVVGASSEEAEKAIAAKLQESGSKDNKVIVRKLESAKPGQPMQQQASANELKAADGVINIDELLDVTITVQPDRMPDGH